MLILSLKILGLIFCLLIFLVVWGRWASRPIKASSWIPTQGIFHCSKHVTAKANQENLGINLVTYNMGYASAEKNNLGKIVTKNELQSNLENILLTLSSTQADLILLQEVDLLAHRSHRQNQLQWLMEKLLLPYCAYTITWNKRYVPWPFWPPRLHFGSLVSGQAILSRYPIAWQNVETLDKPAQNPFWYNAFYPNRILQQVLIQLPSENLSLYNIHLEAYDETTRLKQLAKLKEKIRMDHQKYKIVAGDFNIDLAQNHSKQVLENFSQTTQLHHFNAMTPGNTFPTWQPQEAIDHIFLSKNFSIQSKNIFTNAQGSDHLPVMVKSKLTLK